MTLKHFVIPQREKKIIKRIAFPKRIRNSMSSLIKKELDAIGSVAEWSKALVLGTSHFDGMGSNPTAAKPGPFSVF